MSSGSPMPTYDFKKVLKPYLAAKAKTLAIMDAFVKQSGLQYRGKHHEIYFGDPRKTAPSKLKTILRHPVS